MTLSPLQHGPAPIYAHGQRGHELAGAFLLPFRPDNGCMDTEDL